MTAYRVTCFRGRRNFYRGIGDYSKTVRDGEGKPPAIEQAEALRRKLADSRAPWSHITITPLPDREPA